MLEVIDDSGFLALVVPATYETFVAEDWTYDQIFKHFTTQMRARSLLIWGTGPVLGRRRSQETVEKERLP